MTNIEDMSYSELKKLKQLLWELVERYTGELTLAELDEIVFDAIEGFKGEQEEVEFNTKTCPYLFRRLYCEEVCSDYKICLKEEYRGNYPF